MPPAGETPRISDFPRTQITDAQAQVLDKDKQLRKEFKLAPNSKIVAVGMLRETKLLSNQKDDIEATDYPTVFVDLSPAELDNLPPAIKGRLHDVESNLQQKVVRMVTKTGETIRTAYAGVYLLGNSPSGIFAYAQSIPADNDTETIKKTPNSREESASLLLYMERILAYWRDHIEIANSVIFDFPFGPTIDDLNKKAFVEDVPHSLLWYFQMPGKSTKLLPITAELTKRISIPSYLDVPNATFIGCPTVPNEHAPLTEKDIASTADLLVRYAGAQQGVVDLGR